MVEMPSKCRVRIREKNHTALVGQFPEFFCQFLLVLLRETIGSVIRKGGGLTSYYEPFLGGGALFFGICARTTSFSAHLSDTNEELINAYRVIKESPDELISFLSRFQKEYDSAPDQSAYFYQKRDW